MFVATGQTGLIQSVRHGIGVDAIVEEFMTGGGFKIMLKEKGLY